MIQNSQLGIISTVEYKSNSKTHTYTVKITCSNTNGYAGNLYSNAVYSTPYGFDSHPIKNGYALLLNAGNGHVNPYCIGMVYPIKSGTMRAVSDLKSGESHMYSLNYLMKAANDKLGMIFKKVNSTEFLSKTVLSGEDVALVLNNAFTAIQSALDALKSAYNSHTHDVPGIQGGSATAKSAPTTKEWNGVNLQNEIKYCDDKGFLIDDNFKEYKK